MKKTFTILLFFIFSGNFFYGQGYNLPVQKHSSSELYLDLRDYLEEFPFEYSLGYSMTNFVNPVYGQVYENSSMKPSHGFYVGLRYNKAFPLIIETNFSNSVFELVNEDYFSFTPNNQLTFSGFEAGANLVLMPSFAYFMPYVGGGYGFYSTTSSQSLFDKESTTYLSEKAFTPFIKFGAIINFHEIFYLNAEYKQSLKIDNAFDFSQINVGLGLRLIEDMQFGNHRDYLEEHPNDYSLGYTLMKFANQNYSANLSQDAVKYNYGFYFNLRNKKLLPFIFDFGFTSASFDTKEMNYFDYMPEVNIQFLALEGGLNLTLPAPNFLMPYLGLGYGYYSNATGNSVLETENIQSLKTSTNQGFWKAGLTLNAAAGFFVNVEYKESLSKNTEFSFNQLNAGIGFRTSTERSFDGDAKEDFREDPIIISYGYHETNFLNTAFQTNVANGNITKKWGNTVNLKITGTFPVLIDLGYFSSQFTVSDLAGWQNSDTTKVRHRGGEAALSLALLSKTKFFVPYVGAGYQYSQLYTGPPLIEVEGEENLEIIEMAKNTSSPIYKFGIMLNFNASSFSVEYKHSAFNDDFPFYQLSANIGFKF